MKKARLLAVVGFTLILSGMDSFAQPLGCEYGSSSQWGSGWCNLNPPRTFSSKMCLRLKIGGSASKVLIRLLNRNDDPGQLVGIVGGIQDVPESRQIVLELTRDFTDIKQISIHGNPKAWSYDLGPGNGPAKIESVEEVSCEEE